VFSKLTLHNPAFISSLSQAIQSSLCDQKPTLVAIDGPGCSGKSTLADNLFTHFTDIEIIRIDSFFLPITEQKELRANENLFQSIPHIRWTELEKCLRLLASGKDALHLPYLWDEDRLDDKAVIIHPRKVIIVEGLYALHTRLRDVYNFKIWIDTQFDNRMEQVEIRDGTRFLSLWNKQYVPREIKYIKTQKPYDVANVFVLGLNLDWSCVGKGFARKF